MIAKDCLLIGLGQIGMGYDLLLDDQFIFTHAKAISLHKDFNLVAAVDTSNELRKKFTQTYQLPAYSSLEEALKNSQVSLVVIATPTNTHGNILNIVLQYSTPELILCEKPLDYSLNTATEMLKKCQEKNIMFFVNYMRRSDVGALSVKQMISESLIETPLKGFVWYTKGLMNNGSHFLNLLEYWLGPIQGTKNLSKGRLWDKTDQEHDFIATFDRGEIIFSASNEKSFTYNSIELIGPSGRLLYGDGGERISWHPVSTDPILKGHLKLSGMPEIISNNMNQYQYNVYQEIANAFNGMNYNLSSATDALATLKHIHNIGAQDE